MIKKETAQTKTANRCFSAYIEFRWILLVSFDGTWKHDYVQLSRLAPIVRAITMQKTLKCVPDTVAAK